MSGIIGVSPDMRSAIVGKYPTDHVIGIKGQSTGGSFSGSSTGWAVVTYKEITYTVTSSTSKILIDWGVHVQLEESQNVYRVGMQIRHSVDSYAAGLTGATGINPQFVQSGSSGGWYQLVCPLTAIHDHNQAVGTTITYKVYYKCELGDTLYSWDAWGYSETMNEYAIMTEAEG